MSNKPRCLYPKGVHGAFIEYKRDSSGTWVYESSTYEVNIPVPETICNSGVSELLHIPLHKVRHTDKTIILSSMPFKGSVLCRVRGFDDHIDGVYSKYNFTATSIVEDKFLFATKLKRFYIGFNPGEYK